METYTIIQADGLYPDENVEQEIFRPQSGQDFQIEYHQTHLWPTGTVDPKPWSSIPKDLRDRVDGIEVLKLPFTAEDVELFPNLKVYICPRHPECITPQLTTPFPASSVWV